jgi:WD40 repeat protein/DNA-binding SARP family transcriptional activator
MEFRLLGPVEALDGAEVVDLGGKQRRTVLGILLVHAGEPVSTDRMVDELWAERAPPTARRIVQAHVAHLRKAVNRDDTVLEPAGDGYVAHIDALELDVRTFYELLERARSVKENDPTASVATLKQALGLFRGPPLAGIADDALSLRVEADRLNEARLTATQDLLELYLMEGNASAAVDGAERLVAEQPLRERAWSLLMLGLYRAGRQAEALAAFSRLRQILATELGIEPSPGLRDLEQRILDQDPALEGTGETEDAPQDRGEPRRNPYKGLRPFGEDDAGDFFGRDELTRRLTDELLRRDGGGLVVLAGPSGAGKSSVVRAAVVPRLREAGMDVAVMLPGTDPFAAASEALGGGVGGAPEPALERMIEGGGSLVLVVDQAEELFTLASRSATISSFLDLVGTASPDRLRWLLTIRADFIHQLMLHSGVGRRLEESLVLIPPLQQHEVAAAVKGPAAGVGVGVSPELIAEITHDVAARPALLPLMQYALTDSFDRLEGSVLGLAEYEAAGGISGTLARRADSVLDSLGSDARDAARRVFLRLVTVTDEGESVRRRVPREELAGPGILAEVRDHLIERFGTLRLLTFDRDPTTGVPTVEIAHESLLDQWPRLREWVDQARDDLHTERRLNMALSEWEEADRDPALLLSGGRLAAMEEWAAQTPYVGLTPGQREYLATSRREEDAEVLRLRRRRRVLTTAFGAAAAAIALLALAALVSQQNARASEQSNLVRGLVSGSTRNLGVDPELSILLALEAVDRSGVDVARDVQEALHASVLESRLIDQLPHGGEGIAHVSPTGETFVSSGSDANTVVVRRMDTLDEVVSLTHDDGIGDAVYDGTGGRIATTSLDETLVIWDATTGARLWTVRLPHPPRIPAFSRDGTVLAASTLDGTVWVWEIGGDEPILELGPTPGTIQQRNLEFSPDDRRLAVATGNGAEVWDTETGTLVAHVAEEEYTFDVGFTPDGGLLLTSGENGVTIWDTGAWQPVDTYGEHTTPVWDFQISRDGTTVASSGINEVLMWDLTSLETLMSFAGHIGIVDGIDVTPDGETLITSSSADVTTRIWDATTHGHTELRGFPKPDESFPVLTPTPDGSLLMAGPEPGVLTVRSLPGFENVRDFIGPPDVFDVAYFPDGDKMVMVGEDSGVLLYSSEGEHIQTLSSAPSIEVAVSSSGVVAAGLGDSLGVYTWSDPFDRPAKRWSDLDAFSLAFHPSEPLLAMSLLDSETRVVLEVWNVASGELVTSIPGDPGTPTEHMEFSADGKELVTIDSVGTSTVRDTADYRPIASALTRPRDLPLHGAFDPVRPEYAIVGFDGVLRIWNRETGEELLALPTNGLAGRVAYSPDGRYVIVGSPNGYSVYVRDIHELAEVARSQLTRGLTRAECLQYLPVDECPGA